MSTAPLLPTPQMYYMHQPPAGPQSHIVCTGCQVLLMYPQGASNVRCSRCGNITAAPPAQGTSQVQCNGCRVLLSYPGGAQSVQCSVCHTITPVQVYGHIVCSNCNIMLMYPMGAHSVKCSVCHYVSTVTPGAGGSQGPRQAAGKPPVQTVVVENPPTLDDQGNEVASIAVGVKDGQ